MGLYLIKVVQSLHCVLALRVAVVHIVIETQKFLAVFAYSIQLAYDFLVFLADHEKCDFVCAQYIRLIFWSCLVKLLH